MRTAIKISYYGEPEEGFNISEFKGLTEFKNDLDEDYYAFIQKKTDGYGAGFYELAVEILSDLNLQQFIEFIGTGIAYDVLKSGTENIILKPFLKAYKKLKRKNRSIDIQELKFSFKDSTISIYKIYENSIFGELENILLGLSINYTNLYLKSGEKPFELNIPIFKNPNESNGIKYRCLLSVDETIQNINKEDYFIYWGAYYQFKGWFHVFDYKKQELTNEFYYTEELYLEKVKAE